MTAADGSRDQRGLYDKYRIHVERTDGKPIGPFFIHEYLTDPHARVALAAYAESCAAEHPQLAADLRRTLGTAE